MLPEGILTQGAKPPVQVTISTTSNTNFLISACLAPQTGAKASWQASYYQLRLLPMEVTFPGAFGAESPK